MYKCHVCGKQFSAGNRINSSHLWYEYLHNKQTYKELSIRFHISESTVKRKLRVVKEDWMPIIPQRSGYLLLDVTYFGRNRGVFVAMDVDTGVVIYRKYVRHECLKDYAECVSHLEKQGYIVKGMVIDGMRGLFRHFSDYQVQMCQFHQCAIIRRYLTLNPKLEAGRELSAMMKTLSCSSEEEFIERLTGWETKWADFLNERNVNPETGKSHYIHKKLRSARRSLKTNMPYLFVYLKIDNNGLPNTNNKLEGKFSDLKKNLNNHSGMNKDNRKRFIDGFFKA